MIQEKNIKLYRIGKLVTEFFCEKYPNLYQIVLTTNEDSILNPIRQKNPITMRIYIKKNSNIDGFEINRIVRDYFQVVPNHIRKIMVEDVFYL